MHYLLTETTPATIAPADQTDKAVKRTFNGIANSGKPFVYHGKRAIADLSDITFADKVPALLLHDRDKRVGFGVLSVSDNQLIITGELLDNEHGQALARESDDGFPFQMSAHIIAGFEEKLSHGQTAVVNGQTLTGEITILRKCRVSEVSFTPTGVDNQTMAMILSEQFNTSPTTQESTMNLDELRDKFKDELNELKQKLNELEVQIKALADENNALKEQNTKAQDEAKAAQIEAKLSQKGFVKNESGNWQGINADTLGVLLSLDSDKAGLLIDSLPAPKTAVPEFLLSEQFGVMQHNSNTANPLIENAKNRTKA